MRGRYQIRRIPILIERYDAVSRPYGLWDSVRRCYVDKYGEPVDYNAPANPAHWGGEHYRCANKGVAQMRRDYLNYLYRQEQEVSS